MGQSLVSLQCLKVAFGKIKSHLKQLLVQLNLAQCSEDF